MENEKEVIITPSKLQLRFLEANAAKIDTGNTEWYHFPHYFQLRKDGTMLVVPKHKAPKEIRQQFKFKSQQ